MGVNTTHTQFNPVLIGLYPVLDFQTEQRLSLKFTQSLMLDDNDRNFEFTTPEVFLSWGNRIIEQVHIATENSELSPAQEK